VKDPQKVNFSYRDNLWQGADLLATGIASFGHLSGIHYQNVPEWAQYLSALLDEGRLPLGRAYQPTQLQSLIREMILQLKKGYLDVGYYQSKYAENIYDHWQSEWDELVTEGFAELDRDSNQAVHKIRLTMDGLLRVDGLLPRFFEEHLRGVRYT
jgi:oxygen-independent coproporphyrinogen-3 oxidase